MIYDPSFFRYGFGINVICLLPFDVLWLHRVQFSLVPTPNNLGENVRANKVQ